MGRRARRETSEDVTWKSLEEDVPDAGLSFHVPKGSEKAPAARPGFIALLRASAGSREKGLWRDRLRKARQDQSKPLVKTATVDRGGPADPPNHTLARGPELRVGRAPSCTGTTCHLCLGFQIAPPGAHCGEPPAQGDGAVLARCRLEAAPPKEAGAVGVGRMGQKEHSHTPSGVRLSHACRTRHTLRERNGFFRGSGRRSVSTRGGRRDLEGTVSAVLPKLQYCPPALHVPVVQRGH